MAPITSFISIAPDLALPIRVLLNRKLILTNNILAEHAIPLVLTHNNKLIIRLHKTPRIKLSNHDMKSLVEDLKEDILKICIDKSIEDMIVQYSKSSELNDTLGSKNKLVIPVTSPKRGWKCLVVVQVKSLENLRLFLQDRSNVIPKNDQFSSGAAQLMVRNFEYPSEKEAAVNIRVESDDEDENWKSLAENTEEDTKKAGLNVVYKGKKIVTRGVDLIVLYKNNK